MKKETAMFGKSSIAWFSLVISLLVPRESDALSYASYSAAEITERTSLWVMGRVIQVSGPEVERNQYGEVFKDITLQMEILASTDSEISGDVVIRSRTSFHNRLLPETIVFAAFNRDGENLVPPPQFGLSGWEVVDAEIDRVNTSYGPVEKEIYWKWLQALRSSIDTEGNPDEEHLTFWTEALNYESPAVFGLAMDYQQTLSQRNADSAAAFRKFLGLYEQASKERSSRNAIDYDLRNQLASLAVAVAGTISPQDVNDVAPLILDFILRDSKELMLMVEFRVRDAIFGVIHQVTDSDVLARIPDVCERAVLPNYMNYTLLPVAPSEEIDTWLWEIIHKPSVQNPRSELELGGVLTALANRRDPELRPYLEGLLDGSIAIPPALSPRANPSRLKEYVRDILLTLEHSNELDALSREERLMAWVERAAEGELNLLGDIWRELTPDDRFLIPGLAEITLRQWQNTNHTSPWVLAAGIMKTVPDPAFVPLLRRWSADVPDASLLTALYLCGEETLAIKRAARASNGWLWGLNRRELRETLTNRSGLVTLLGSMEDPALVKHFRDYTQQETVESLERRYRARAGNESDLFQEPYAVWRLRDAALLAMVRSGHADAADVLREAYATHDIRGRFVAAMALYHLGDDRGIELVNAYRTRSEHDIPEWEERRHIDFAGGEIAVAIISSLNDPKLDELYFERTKSSFSHDDRYLAQDSAFYERHRERVLRMLITHIDDPNPEIRNTVIYCLQHKTGQNFGYDRNALGVRNQAAIEQWKRFVAREM